MPKNWSFDLIYGVIRGYCCPSHASIFIGAIGGEKQLLHTQIRTQIRLTREILVLGKPYGP
ncbi:hypothetical protein HanIR_Chr02g0091951 [Helianthus annuus]|nr:hypothetical protein HanIR_Chr02g0091951 [Helianthus annuus]